MRARTAALAAGPTFMVMLWLGAAILWTSYGAVPGSLPWLAALSLSAGFIAALFSPRPVGGRVLLILTWSAFAAGLCLVLLGFFLGRHSPVEPFTFLLILLPALFVLILGYAGGQWSRRGQAA